MQVFFPPLFRPKDCTVITVNVDNLGSEFATICICIYETSVCFCLFIVCLFFVLSVSLVRPKAFSYYYTLPFSFYPWHDREVVNSRTWGMFIRDTAYFIVIQWSISSYFIESQWNMPYAVFRMKMPHVRESAISLLTLVTRGFDLHLLID